MNNAELHVYKVREDNFIKLRFRIALQFQNRFENQFEDRYENLFEKSILGIDLKII